MSFVHLHVHSEYSLLEASNTVKDLAAKAKTFSQPALALTDLGNMFGAIEFYFGCLNQQVKPILGLECYLTRKSRLEKTSTEHRDVLMRGPERLVFLAQNLAGYKNLCKLSTLGYQEGFYYKPRIDDELIQRHHENLICLSGGLRGDIAVRFMQEGPDAALQRIQNLKAIFGDRFYLEIQKIPLPELTVYNQFLQEVSRSNQIKLVATNEVYYLTPEDQIAQEVLVCIGQNRTLQDEHRPKLGSNQFYLKSSEDMKDLFHDLPEALESTLEIAERTNLKFKLKDDHGKAIYHLPSYPTKDGISLKEEIRRLSLEGVKDRFKEAERRKEAIDENQKQSYFDRLDFELGVIDRMGFNGYFLIVQDFINWAKMKDIPVGPGRGSGAGSLVAYSLKITDLDPMPYKLLFERFLNPERVSMPDFDIDFCQDRRVEVIQYVTEKYGAGSVSQIITYGKLQCRAALKDVGRVLGLSFAEVDVVSKLVPDKLNITIDEALEMEPRLRELMDQNPQVLTLIDLAKKVEGLVRHAGIHAAGVIIADGNLVDHAPLYRGSEGENVVQYDMKHAEKIGLIKFDFLGLKTLTSIHQALKLIQKNQGKTFTTNDISLHDQGIYQIISEGDTDGIFQFEADGVTEAIRKIRPSNFFDITAINALNRPGPMAMIPEFAKRKHGESPVEYLLDELKEVLEETYGIIVYQEQVMAIASRIAGFTLGEADMLRRAMGKKIKEEMDVHREHFLKGAAERGHDKKKSEEIFELMYKFADYGFNKSHAAAYCVVAAQTAWLKRYFPCEFYASLLSIELGNTDNIVKYVKDAQGHQLKVHSPNVNQSDFLFSVLDDNIYFGLGAIKGVGENAVDAILQARSLKPNQKFESVDDFFQSVDVKKLNKRVIESLIKAGAFDVFLTPRADLMAYFPKLMELANEKRKEKESGQVSFFDLSPVEEKLQIPSAPPWNRTQNLALEKEVLGFYLSDHPLKGYERLSQVWVTGNLKDLGSIYNKHLISLNSGGVEPAIDPKRGKHSQKKRVVVSGMIAELREVITKKGTRMAFAKLEDLTDSCELIVFPDTFAQVQQLLKDERPLLIGGFLEVENTNPKIFVDSIIILEDAFKKTKKLTFDLKDLSYHQLKDLKSLLVAAPGNTAIEFKLFVQDLKKEVVIQSDEVKGIQLSNDLLEKIKNRLGDTSFIEVQS